MALSLFNTLSRKPETLPTAEKWPYPTVNLYTCGPTVYNYLHVGNYRTYIFEDTLKRTLKYLGHPVRHVMNITDVGHLTSQADEGEDKVEAQAAKEGKTARDIARFYENTFLEDIEKLNIDFHPGLDPKVLKDIRAPGDVLCRATDHIPEQIDLIRRLEKNGFTYRTSDGIYYDTSKFGDYGRLMGKAHLRGLQAGARVETNPEKHHQTDFALWKFSPKDTKRQMEWDSPWGRGFPGWHIECSAMAMKYLGDSFDIHCGGVDHIPIHHTNEIAQAEGATGKSFVRYWLHGEFLLMNNAKMAKSSGGFLRLKDLIDKGFDPLDFRYLCLTAHYRKQLDFTWESLDAAKTARLRLRGKAIEYLRSKTQSANTKSRDIADQTKNKKIKGVAFGSGARQVQEWLKLFRSDIADDLNMPKALSTAHIAISHQDMQASEDQLAFLFETDKVLGLRLTDPPVEDSLTPKLESLLKKREEARGNKDFAGSDALRKALAEKGIIVEDTPQGQRWKKKQ